MTSVLNLNALRNKEWYVEHLDCNPAFTEMSASGFTRPPYGKKYPLYDITICFYKDEEGDWMTMPARQKLIGSTIVKNYLNNKKGLGNYYRRWLNEFKAMLDFFYKNFNLDLSKFNNDELKSWMNDFYDFYRNKINAPWFIDGYMFYADKRFDVLVREFCEKNKIADYREIYSRLSAPVAPSFINEEENDLKKIKKLIGGAKNLKIAIKKNKAALELLAKHLEKYSWIKSSYAGFEEYKMDDVLKEIKANLNNNEDNSNIFDKRKKDKKGLIKKHGFTPEILAISDLTEKMVKWQDQRKIYTLTFVSLQSKTLKDLEKRVSVDYNLLKYATICDLYLILDHKFNAKELSKRAKSSLFVYQNGKITKIVSGRSAEDFFRKVNKVKLGDIKEINGMTASVGKAKGIVKIITSAKLIHKVNKGDILVAPMTRPEHLAGMKKAAAIVTDDGGITCHAAIIARELKIPCIIGTKIATKVLKDGDLVEVDADNGVVKIIH